MRLMFLVLCSPLFSLSLTRLDSVAQTQRATPVQGSRLTSEQEHQRVMEQLHVKTLRRGADGDPNSPFAANYDEEKANLYPTLPDPLLLANGTTVTTPKMWWERRRPEIAEEFEQEVFGRVPKETPKVTWGLISTKKEKNGEVPVVTKKLSGHLDNSTYPLLAVDIDLTLTMPADVSAPVPVIMELSLTPEILAALAKRFPQNAPSNLGPTWQAQVLARGWGYATYIPISVQPDDGEGLSAGVIGLTNRGKARKLDDWGALRAWAWGARRP